MILPIKKKWYDMILSGEKKEEYREMKSYYTKRFQTIGLLNAEGQPTNKTTCIVFRNGYSGNSPSIAINVCLEIKTGNEKWGAVKGEYYYTLKII